jgi:hypothetical protein
MREKVKWAQNTKNTMVAVEPLAAFSNISAPTQPRISTKFDKETVNDVENHLPEFHCHWLESRGIRWPRVVGARWLISENQRKITTNSGVTPSIMVGFEQFDVFWKDNLISHILLLGIIRIGLELVKL